MAAPSICATVGVGKVPDKSPAAKVLMVHPPAESERSPQAGCVALGTPLVEMVLIHLCDTEASDSMPPRVEAAGLGKKLPVSDVQVLVGAASALSVNAVTTWLVQLAELPVPLAAPVLATTSVPFHLKYPPVVDGCARRCQVGVAPMAKIPSPRTAAAAVVSPCALESRLCAPGANVDGTPLKSA